MTHLVAAPRLTALVLALAAVGCSAPSLDVALRAQSLALDGDVGASSGGGSATSSADALGLDDDPWVFSPRVDVAAGPRITVDTFRAKYDGTGTAEADFTVGGVTISDGTDVDSRFELALTRAVITFSILPLGPVYAGLGVGVALAEIDAELEEIGSGTVVATDEMAPVPFLAARVGGGIWRVDFELLAAFTDLDIGDVDATYLDIEAFARLRLFDAGFHGDLVLGYRWMQFDVDYDDGDSTVQTDLELSGPYVGVSIGL